MNAIVAVAFGPRTFVRRIRVMAHACVGNPIRPKRCFSIPHVALALCEVRGSLLCAWQQSWAVRTELARQRTRTILWSSRIHDPSK